jgi:predicted ATPase/DNA-binding SARP family transcriptional activator
MAHLSLGVLGSLQVLLDGTPVTTLESDKVRALLAYLAVEADRPHRRETLVGLLWPDYPEQAARHNLRQVLFNLRSSLSDQTANPPYFLITRDSIQFNRESDFSLDLEQFNHYYSTCEKNLSQRVEDSSTHAAHLEEMVKLYRGEFLEQLYLGDSTEFEEWTLVQRERAHQRVLEAHSNLANYYELQGDNQAARRHALRQLELEPWREEAHRQNMRLLALSGERGAALAQYDTYKELLAKELDVEPSAETRELYEQILLGTLSAKIGQRYSEPSTPVRSLPVLLTPFIGRELELAQLGQLITNPECRCITITGPGGIGKTRLAVQAAGDHLGEFAHGAIFVPLASVGSYAGVIPAIAKAIYFSFYGPEDPKIQLLNYLCEKQMLIILDNIEHLLIEATQQENIAHFLIEILESVPGVKLLVTTREALNLQEEWVFEVGGLEFPEATQTVGFEQFDAVALFVQRARRAFPKFELSEENQAEVARICRLVEGLPLAIELAATWMRTLSPAEIAIEIENSLDFLSASVRDLPERHRSMRVVFDHSWQMLSTAEQQVLRKLSVFQGGFRRQAAEQVAGATLSILSTLVNRTLLRRTANNRYDLHELIKQYSAGKLAIDPQAKTIAQLQHFEYYLALAETAEQEIKGRDQLEWLSKLEQDHDNLRVAFEWALDRAEKEPNADELALRLSSSLRWFWRMRGHFHEGSNWLIEALQRDSGNRTSARARALVGLSLLLHGLGDLGAARSPAEESINICKELRDQEGLAEANMVAGLTFLWQGDATLGHARTREALDLYRQAGDRWGEAHALYRLGSYLADYGGDRVGREMLEESASILEELGDKYLYTSVLISLGIVDLGRGDYPDALLRFERGLTAAREIRHPWGIADALTNLGCLYRIRGDYAAAQAHFDEALQVYRGQGPNITWEIDVLCAMAENEIVQGNLSSARLHLQSAGSLVVSSDNRWLQVLVGYFRGLLAYYEGDAEEAAGYLKETTALAREGHFKPDLARSLVTLGRVMIALGDVARSSELIREGLVLFQGFGHKLGFASALEALAAVSAAQHDDLRAVTLFATAQALREAMGAPLPPVDRPSYDSAIAFSRAQLGETAFADAWARAIARPYEDVVEEESKSPGA